MPDRPTLKILEDYLEQPIPGVSHVETQLVRAVDAGSSVPWPTTQVDEPRLYVEVEHGIWMVRCPHCPSAQRACFSDRRFYCVDKDCPRPFPGAWLTVVWPDNWAQIEQLLLVRPDSRYQHWQPTETLADLEAQNAEHRDALLPAPAASGLQTQPGAPGAHAVPLSSQSADSGVTVVRIPSANPDGVTLVHVPPDWEK